jgi:hypothetical protein
MTTGFLSDTYMGGANKLVQWDPARSINELTDLTAEINQALNLHSDADSVAGDGTFK